MIQTRIEKPRINRLRQTRWFPKNGCRPDKFISIEKGNIASFSVIEGARTSHRCRLEIRFNEILSDCYTLVIRFTHCHKKYDL